MFLTAGYPYIGGAALLAVATFAMALRWRSWPLWVVAFAFTVGTLCVAWHFRAAMAAGAMMPVTPS